MYICICVKMSLTEKPAKSGEWTHGYHLLQLPKILLYDLSLNSTNPSFSTYCKPHHYSLALKQTRTRTTWKSETEDRRQRVTFWALHFIQCLTHLISLTCAGKEHCVVCVSSDLFSNCPPPSFFCTVASLLREMLFSHSLAVYSKPPDSSDSWITKWTLSDWPFFILLHNPWLCSKLHFKSYHPFDTTWLISPIREQHSLALNPKWFSSLQPPSLLSWNHLSGYQASFRSSQVWWAMGSLTTPTMDLDCEESTGHRS